MRGIRWGADTVFLYWHCTLVIKREQGIGVGSPLIIAVAACIDHGC